MSNLLPERADVTRTVRPDRLGSPPCRDASSLPVRLPACPPGLATAARCPERARITGHVCDLRQPPAVWMLSTRAAGG